MSGVFPYKDSRKGPGGETSGSKGEAARGWEKERKRKNTDESRSTDCKELQEHQRFLTQRRRERGGGLSVVGREIIGVDG